MIRIYIALCLFGLCFCFSCQLFQPKEQADPIARVGSVYLPETVINSLVTETISPEDSAQIVDSYIDNWIEKQVLVQNASENLTPEQLAEVDNKVLEYKESLLSHLYETRLLNQRVDSVVSEEELIEYYESHQKDFAVAEPIVQFFYVKNDKEFKNSSTINQWLNQYLKTENDAELTEYCSLQAISCSTKTDTWVSASTFYETLGLPSGTNNIALRKGGLMKYKSENYFYLYKLFSVQDSGIYPFEYVKGKIEEIIKRKRKQDFLEQLHNDVLESAKNNNEIEVYVE